MRRFILFLALTLMAISAYANIHIVAAENMYGNIAQALGGKNVSVSSILNNPNQDPHLFSADPKTVKLLNSLSSEDIMIVNGADYDPWAVNLLNDTKAQVINVAKVNNVTTGSNPHLWYNLAYVESFAKTLAGILIKNDPSHQAEYQKNLDNFLDKTNQLQQQINVLKTHYPNLPITATEPVAGYLLDALGFNVLDQGFQLSIMNDTEPSAKDRAQIIDDLKSHKVVLLVYNEQVKDPTTDMIKEIAMNANIAIVGVSELMPPDMNYISWYQANLNSINTTIKNRKLTNLIEPRTPTTA
ncbi:MAG: cation transporter substrate-binding protein [Gammaproteobacteria bacterium]|jgi:zinc/manganese transport system substrate-binding protein|nr:cation transporter substrate-binding protein [Gammaproteobacteria bacterium]